MSFMILLLAIYPDVQHKILEEIENLSVGEQSTLVCSYEILRDSLSLISNPWGSCTRSTCPNLFVCVDYAIFFPKLISTGLHYSRVL